MTGRTLGNYQVLESLGSGGMGEVFKARDMRLNRLVAVKVLRSDRLTAESRKQRFIQEAQAASALNHPNIVTIHDIGQQDGADYLVMEYIAGQTLDALIPRQGMRLTEALRIAAQMAEGLRRAHAAGIVHRDLKPSNVMVSTEGNVKILDFGLAKLTDPESFGDDPTETIKPRTEEGTILGTASYMSPEQAEGRKLDARSDIFSFGIVLYEMLAGHRPFAGDSRMATMAAILRQEPKPLENIPPDLEKIVRRCLRKDLEKRFQHMDDLKVALEEVREDSDSGKLTPVTAAKSTSKMGWVAGAAAMLACVVGAGVWMTRRSAEKPAGAQGLVLRQITFDAGLAMDPTVWASGNQVAYASDRGGSNLDIWVQSLQTHEARRLTTHEADDREPAFSPDGSRIAFRSERDGGGIYVISTVGGQERRIADGGRHPRFSPDGQWVAYHTGFYSYGFPYASGGSIFLVQASGGTPKAIASDFDAVSEPVWSPDGKLILFLGGPKVSEIDWWAASVDGGAPVRAGALSVFEKQKLKARQPWLWLGDTVYFSADVGDAINIWRTKIDAKTMRVASAERVTSGSSMESAATLAGSRLIFASMTENADIWSLPIEPDSGKLTGEPRRLTEELAPNLSSSVTRDGRQIVFFTIRGGATQIVWKDLVSGQERVLAATNSKNQSPAPRISPDGSMVAYTDYEANKSFIQLVPSAGGPVKRLCDGCSARNWAVAGNRLIASNNKGTGWMDLVSGAFHMFLGYDTRAGHSAPRTSPDDRWLVFYTIVRGGDQRTKVFIAPLREPPVPVSEWMEATDGSSWDAVAEFSPNGNTLYFLSQRDGFRCHWALKLDPATKKPVGKPYPVQHYHSARRSPAYVGVGRVANAVAADKIVFTMAERTGNIWMADLSGADK